jgi:hypothetical protein
MASPGLKPPAGRSLQGSTPSVSSDAGETPSTSSFEPSNAQCTPESSGSDRASPPSGPVRFHHGLRIETDFDKEADVEAEDETQGFISERHHKPIDGYDDGSDSEADIKNTPRDRVRLRKADYTTEEEKQVVKIFDKRVVLFLALLYLLSFLDRSSEESKCLKSLALTLILVQILATQRLLDLLTI